MRKTTGAIRPPRLWAARWASLIAAGAIAAAGRRGRTERNRRRRPGPRDGLGPRLDHDRERGRQAERSRRGRLLHGSEHRPDDRRRPRPDLPDAWTGSAPRSPTPPPRCSTRCPPPGAPGDAPCSTRGRRSASASCASRSAPPTSPPRPRTTPTTTCRPGETDFGLRHFSIAHDQAQILPLLRQAQGAQPAAQRDGHAVEPAGLDEDRRLACRRAAQRRPAGLRRLRPLPGEVRPGVRAAGRAVDYLTVQNEPQNRKPDGYPGTDMPVAQEAEVIEALGPLLQAASPRTEDPRATTTTGPPTPTTSRPRRARTRTRLPVRAAGQHGREVDRRHRLPLLLRRPQRADRAARRVPEQGHLVHRVLRLARSSRPADSSSATR